MDSTRIIMMMKLYNHIRTIILLLFIILFSYNANSQNSMDQRQVSILPVPAIGYSPETKTYIGAVTLLTISNPFDTLTRTSNAEIEFNYTWNKQIIVESVWNYFTAGEVWFTRGLLHYSKYPDVYYGIGAVTTDAGKLNFEGNRFMLDLDVLRNIGGNRFFGAGVIHKTFGNIQKDSLAYPELMSESNYGLKVLYLKDSRNSILSPTMGNYFEISNAFNTGSSFYYSVTMDWRHYKGFNKTKRHVLAGRLYHNSIFGTPPFYDYAMIGGDEYARGYYLGRYRDKHFSTFQFEYRSLLFWRIGLAAFGGISAIYNEFTGIEGENLKPNAGLGLRFLADKKENTSLRIDYAIGTQNQSGFYISFGESF